MWLPGLFIHIFSQDSSQICSDLDFQERGLARNDFELFQRTPEVSLQILILALPALGFQNRSQQTRFSYLEHIFTFGRIFGGGPQFLGLLFNLRVRAIYTFFLLGRASRSGQDLDFLEKQFSRNDFRPFQLTPPDLNSGFLSSPSKNRRSKHQIFTFGAYFRFQLDLSHFGVAHKLPKVVIAIDRFSRLGSILVLGRILFDFWRWPAGFQKWSQQLSGFHVWILFWSSGGYLAFGGSTLLGTVALVQSNWDVSAYFRAQPPDSCFS